MGRRWRHCADWAGIAWACLAITGTVIVETPLWWLTRRRQQRRSSG